MPPARSGRLGGAGPARTAQADPDGRHRGQLALAVDRGHVRITVAGRRPDRAESRELIRANLLARPLGCGAAVATAGTAQAPQLALGSAQHWSGFYIPSRGPRWSIAGMAQPRSSRTNEARGRIKGRLMG